MPESYDEAVASSKKYVEEETAQYAKDRELTYGKTDSAEEARQQIKAAGHASNKATDELIAQVNLIDGAKSRARTTYGPPKKEYTREEILEDVTEIVTYWKDFGKSAIIRVGVVIVAYKTVSILGQIATQRFGKK